MDNKCEWKGTVGMLAGHLTTCEFIPMLCPKNCKNANGEITCFIKSELEKHLAEDCPNRDYKCEHCGKKGMHGTIMKVHDKT